MLPNRLSMIDLGALDLRKRLSIGLEGYFFKTHCSQVISSYQMSTTPDFITHITPKIQFCGVNGQMQPGIERQQTFSQNWGGAHPGIRRREGVRLPRFRCAPSMLLRFATEHCPLTAAGGKPLQPDTLPPPEMNVSISPESHRHRRPEPRTGAPHGRSARENYGRLSAGVSCPRERRSQPHISL